MLLLLSIKKRREARPKERLSPSGGMRAETGSARMDETPDLRSGFQKIQKYGKKTNQRRF